MFKNLCASGGGLPLCPENLQLYTMILQRPRIIVGHAGFEPKTSGPEVWCVTTTLRWQISEITWEERVPGQCHALDTVVVGRHQVHLGGDYPAPAITHLKHLKKKITNPSVLRSRSQFFGPSDLTAGDAQKKTSIESGLARFGYFSFAISSLHVYFM